MARPTAEDELAIRNLLARLAQMADMASDEQLTEYANCFTEDGVWDGLGGQIKGRAAIIAGARERRRNGIQGPGTNTRHIVNTIQVRFTGDDEAVSEAYFQLLADTATSPVVRVAGHYYDTLRRTPDGWKMANRTITMG